MKPNLLVILPHDLGQYSSVYGAPVHTPHLHAFSQTATSFTNALAAAPTCSPSRASLFTGLYPHQSGMTGLTHLGFRLLRTDRHLAARLRASGYRTVLSGVQHEAPSHEELGYTDYIGSDPEGPFQPDFDPVKFDRTNAEACASFLSSSGNSGGAPWFLSLGLFLPHRPFVCGDTVTPTMACPAGLPPTESVRDDVSRFHASVREMDTNTGTVLSALEASGQGDTTMVVIVTDHGIDFPRYKNTLSDGGLAVTLMTRVPGQGEARVSASLVSLVDLYPTILEVLGAQPPEDMDLSDAQAIATSSGSDASGGAAEHTRVHAFSEMNYHVSYQPERCVSTSRYRLHRRYHSHSQVLPNIGDSPSKDAVYREYPPVGLEMGRHEGLTTMCLYDRWYDPLQNSDLRSVTALSPVVNELEHALDRFMQATEDPILGGTVPAPASAAVAAVDLYSSHSADDLIQQELHR